MEFTERFLFTPNLPKNDVSLVIMSGKYPSLTAQINRLGIAVAAVEEYPLLAEPVRSHADMLIHHLGKNVFAAVDTYTAEILKIRGAEIIYINERLCSVYPNDVLLNFARVGNRVFGRMDIMPAALREYFNDNGIELINVNQGYAKCSTAIIDKNSIITSDKTIACAAEGAGMDVLCISPGSIVLDGYDTGFIGGCCGKIGEKTIVFTGDIYTHPDGKKIADFISDRKIEAVTLSTGPLLDIGGIIPAAEIC